MCGFPWGGLHLITGVFVLNLNEQSEVLQAPMSRHRLLAFRVYLQIPDSVLRAPPVAGEMRDKQVTMRSMCLCCGREEGQACTVREHGKRFG